LVIIENLFNHIFSKSESPINESCLIFSNSFLFIAGMITEAAIVAAFRLA